MTPKYRGATSIPAKMWKKLIEIARTYPAPHQFYEKAVALGKDYDITEKELIAWGTIDPHHKPKITEQDIVRGHREERRGDPQANILGEKTEKP